MKERRTSGSLHYRNRAIKSALNLSLCFMLLHNSVFLLVAAFSETKTSRPARDKYLKQKPSVHVTLQSCYTPESILENVAVSLTPQIDSSGALSRMTLVRLSKQLVSIDNTRNNLKGDSPSITRGSIANEEEVLWEEGLKNAIYSLISSNWRASSKSLELFVDGVKSAAVISRLLPIFRRPQIGATVGVNRANSLYWWWPLYKEIIKEDIHLAAVAEPHQLSGLKWAIDCFQLSMIGPGSSCELPQNLQRAYDDLDLPFMIRPGFLKKSSSRTKSSSLKEQSGDHGMFTVSSFIKQVDFRTEKIQTKSKRSVMERRKTAWQGDDNVSPFEYSGKLMERMPWSAVVADVRDRLFAETSHYYDGCLLNLYPDGGSGMRYHIDPDQGVRWAFETAVVSIGATRRFAFRSISGEKGIEGDGSKPHSFVLMDGDVTEMVRDCQDRFQHTVKTAELKGETAPRVSLVFKKTFDKR